MSDDMCRRLNEHYHYRMMAVFTDGGVSTRTMGEKLDHAIDVYNVTVYGSGHEDLMFCTLIAIGANDAGIGREVIKTWARDHRSADEIEWDKLRVAEMAQIEARAEQPVPEPA